ncbi:MULTISPECIES: ATP-binding protein [unclassified Lentimicrobium]|uniref:ATP-binding protein n=1 Tax=unclassified Lentimicrobium TaxID=2677434 RepID=UPI0015577D58|nr:MULTISPECIES: ATP-binding protein [unclassified Lentimicrobium]NPD44131.1 ATP-binding protein [Lentimicrobium sp. S6]NPD86718.1 ATP-binding protein [Lentimicrobium sp. L6]
MEERADFKNKELKLLWDQSHQPLLDGISHYYQMSIGEFSNFVDAYKLRYEKLGELDIQDLSSYAHLREFKESILDLLQKSQEAIINYDHIHSSGQYQQILDKLIKTNPKSIIRKEVFEGYQINNKLRLPQFFQKIRLNFLLKATRSKKKFYNFFRRLFKKTPLDLQSYRRRKIPYQSMLEKYLGIRMDELMKPILEDLMLNKSQILLAVWEFDEALEDRLQNGIKENESVELSEILSKTDFSALLDTLEKKISHFEQQISGNIENTLFQAFIELDKAILIADTPDLSNNKFRNSNIKDQQTKIVKSYNDSLLKWKNTHKTLLDDWTVDVEIVWLYVSVLDNYVDLHDKISLYINENLNFNLELLREFINNSSKTILEKSSTVKELKSTLKGERKKNQDEFIENILAKTIDKLSGNINRNLELFNTQTMNLVEKISDKRSFVKNKNYEGGIKNSDINWLSLRDLLNFEALPHFKTSILEIEQFVEEHLEKSRVKLLALGTVSDFSLESAEMMLQEKKTALKESIQVVTEGYDRALVHLDEASSLMDKIKVDPLEKLQATINNFNTEIQKLKNTENILELNVKIVRIRAIERSKRIRKEAWEWIINFLPKSIDFLKTQFATTITYINEVKKKLGMINEKPHISHELSDFLRKTEDSLKKLPFVYQRLYQLTPTDEERFFVDRKEELEKLQHGFSSWEKGRFVTTAIIGEKGSGITSLLLYFLKSIDKEIPVRHHILGNKIYEFDAYFAFFAQIFKQESFTSNDQIIAHVNQLKEEQIIIIENLQHLYLKKVRGFGCQKMLFDLMTSTSKKIFWLGTYTSYSWEYLEKTLKISSVFINEVHLQRFTDENTEEIILKRNYLSGYKIDFEPSESQITSKSYIKLNDKDQQAYLKKSFFKELNQMSNGNVSLAQLYWLRSTHGINEDTIKIQSLRDFDVSFDKDLPSNYLFALHAILVHDGLIIEDYSQVFKAPEYICRNDLIPMLEKGLLIKPKEKYNINPIIFRQVVDLLRSHNFIN